MRALSNRTAALQQQRRDGSQSQSLKTFRLSLFSEVDVVVDAALFSCIWGKVKPGVFIECLVLVREAFKENCKINV